MEAGRAAYRYVGAPPGSGRRLPANGEPPSSPGKPLALASLARWPVLAVAVAAGLVLLLTSGGVGYFIDELYFLAAGHHLDWGYVDQGPLVPLLTRAMDIVFPGSLVGLRLPATALAIVGVVVAALIARELGGGAGRRCLPQERMRWRQWSMTTCSPPSRSTCFCGC